MNEARRRAAEHFDEALDADAAGRTRLIAALAEEDAEAAAELELLLAADGTDGMLDVSLSAFAPDLIESLQAPQGRTLKDGDTDTVGPYRLVSLIGSGGMGEVYLAERSGEGFSQRVALKLLHGGPRHADIVQRFERERRILAQLEHPNIARLIDGGAAHDGTPYLAMEYVEGQSITDYADAKVLSPTARAALIRQAADAVAHAHARLVVHRDLKPSNLLVDAQGQVRVLDFGIAKLLDEAEDARLTATGATPLTPAYAAPEQIRDQPVTTATDVYALGGVLFELLTGRVPHPERVGGSAVLLRSLDRDNTERPSTLLAARARSGDTTAGRTTERYIREVRGDLDVIVLKALHPDPARRYPGAAQLAEDLRRFADGRPIAARPDTATYRFTKFVARHRYSVGSASAVLLALIGGFAIALWQAGVAREAAIRADQSAELAKAEAARADREAKSALQQVARSEKIRGFLAGIFTNLDPLRRDAKGERTLAEAFDEALAQIDTEFADDAPTRIDLLDDFGEIRAGQGDFDGADELFRRALALAEATLGPDHPTVAESALNLGVLAGYRGRALDGQAHLQRAVVILEQHDDKPDQLAAALSGLANVYHAIGDSARAIEMLQSVLSLRRQHSGDDDQVLAIALQNLSTALLAAGRHDDARPMVDEAIERITRVQGPEGMGLVPALWLRDDIEYHDGRYTDEAATIKREVKLVRMHFPGDHWWKARTLVESGFVTARDGDIDAGRRLLEEAVAIFERLDSPQLLDAERRLGQLELLAGNPAAAVLHFKRAMDICESSGKALNPTCLQAGINHAEAVALTGDGAEALKLIDPAAALIVDKLGAESDAYAQALAARAAAFDALGRPDEATAARRERADLLQRLYGDAHPLVVRTRAALK